MTRPKRKSSDVTNESKEEVKSPKDTQKKSEHENLLEQLRKYSIVVADTGEFSLLKKYRPEDATTNPSLIYKASVLPEYKHLIDDVIKEWKKTDHQGQNEKEEIEILYDRIIVTFGCEILKLIKGRVSTEVDARYSFDKNTTIKRAKRLIQFYKEKGIEKERVLIKIAATWEGIEACKVLQKEGILCNMTLIFSLTQAIACAKAGATLVSPFVGRILDWHKSNNKDYATKEYNPKTDPGVLSVKEIYYYYKKFGYKTIVMGASFRNMQEILELSGCDRLTISPQLLEELSTKKDLLLPCHVRKEDAKEKCPLKEELHYSESEWRYQMNDNQMACDKLSEGIRNFAADGNKLAMTIKENMKAKN